MTANDSPGNAAKPIPTAFQAEAEQRLPFASTVLEGLGEPDSGRPPRILSLCCLYPNPLLPDQGLFVQRRLRHLAELAEIKVVSPFAIVQYGSPKGKRLRLGGASHCPHRSEDGGVCVLRPRWFYPPLSGSLTPFWLSLQLLPVLARIRNEFPFEVIDAHFGHPEGIAGALLSSVLKVPFTMTLRGNEPKHSKSRMGRFLMGWALRRASRVFTVSGRLRQFAIEMGAEPRRVAVIPNGIDASVFFTRDRAACRTQYGFAVDRPLIVCAGALVERKGHHRVINALAAMRTGENKPQLAIAGGRGPEGQYEEQLRSLVDRLELTADVRFLGPLPPDQLAEVMSAADVCCLASTNEGWPNVVHEALACGTPVVATDVGAVPDMLAGGLYGVIVPIHDEAALRRGLEEALRKKWDRQAIAAWGQARSWRHVAGEVLEEMRAMIQERAY
jgi:teichuronic acid biosynthesis glycosyltransferase TuaC